MTQEKMRKVIAASVSAATVLFVLLFSYLIYQWITIAVYDARIRELEAENARLEQAIEEGTMDAEWYEMNKEYLAWYEGWVREEENEEK